MLAIGFALKLGTVLWALDRGFELGDEGYFLLNLEHPRDAPVVFQYYRLLTPFGDAFHVGVVDARLLRLAIELLASAALLAGVWAWARARVVERDRGLGLGFVLFGLLGTLLGTGTRSLSYNDVTNLFSYGTMGALFCLASLPSGAPGRHRRSVWALVAGLSNGLELGVKFPTALLLAGVVAIALGFVFRPMAARERLRVAFLYAVGGLLAIGLYLAVSGGVGSLIAELRRMPEVARSAGYDPLHLLWFYAKGEVVTAVHVIWLTSVYGGTLALLRRFFFLALDPARAVSLAAGALALACSVRLVHPFFLHPSLVLLSALLAFALVLLLALDHRERRGEPGRFEALAPLFLLMALPLVDIAGTNVPISQRLPTHALPLFAALGVLSLDLRRRAGQMQLHAALAVVLLVATSVAFLHHHLIAPYGLPRDISEQRYEVEGLPEVRVDFATKNFLESVGAAMREAGFQPGDPVLALDYMPGLVYYLGGSSPGFTLYLFDNPRLNCFNVNRFYHAPPYLILGRPMSAEQAACLQVFSFPDDFRLLGSVRFPYDGVYWRFGARGLAFVHLYAPRRDRDAAPGERAAPGLP